MKGIELLDCTLGIGAELIEWNFGEKTIGEMQLLLGQSRAEIVEIGLLQSYQKGPNTSIYSSGSLPAAFVRREGQLYAGWMSKMRIKASDLPERSAETLDIIRVPLSADAYEEELAYCADLKERGYLVAAMLEYSARAARDELDRVLKKVNRLKPWAFGIIDVNGILSKPEWEELLARLDRGLGADVRIGFHGADNLGLAAELAQLACRMELAHTLCLDASVYGLGVGGCGLATEKIAEWLNENFHKDYELYTLRALTEYVKPYLTEKRQASTRLAYHLTGERGCSYRYAEYLLSELGLDVSVLHDVLSELSDESALRFDKKAANKALRAFRKKRLNIILVIPTAQRWKAVDTLLFCAAKDLLKYGVDVEIYDSSTDDRTAAVVRNFQLDGYDNVSYTRYTGEYDGFSLDRKVISAFERHLDYDYIWVCRDGLIPRIADFSERLLECADRKTDYVVVDAAFRNNKHFLLKSYDNCLDFFTDNSARMTMLGCCIFRSGAMRSILEHQPLNDSNYGVWIGIAPLQELAVRPFKTQLIVANVFDYNSDGPKRPLGDDKMLERWGRRWYEMVTGLPDVYDPGKPAALRIQMQDFHPFYLRQLLRMRGEGAFDLSVLRKYGQYLPYVSDTARWKYYLAAVTPRFLARMLVSHERSRLMQKILSLYGRI